MFSLLGLNHAYVTTLGRLVGVVALKEVSQIGDISEDKKHNNNFGLINSGLNRKVQISLMLAVNFWYLPKSFLNSHAL